MEGIDLRVGSGLTGWDSQRQGLRGLEFVEQDIKEKRTGQRR
jgi:hypothetical protein